MSQQPPRIPPPPGPPLPPVGTPPYLPPPPPVGYGRPPFAPGDPPPTPARLPTAPERLHPRTVLVRAGAPLVALIYLFGTSLADRTASTTSRVTDVAVCAIGLVIGIGSWFVTTWSVQGDTVEVASGIIRRRVIRVPLARVQAVDLVEPWMARLVGLAEIRLRTGGDRSGDARLTYLRTVDAHAVRAALVAMVHGLPSTTSAAPERPLVAVSNRRLVLSTLLLGSTISLLVFGGLEVGLLAGGLGHVAAASLVYVFAPTIALARRIANEWGLTVGDSPDGLRVQAGLGSRLRETIPPPRIQALHRSEPLFWRPFGWQRLQLHLAGGVARASRQPRSALRRALLPVGVAAEADLLLGHVLGRTSVPMRKPPARGRVRSPLSYHFLSAGYDEVVAVSTFGRVCRRTEFVPLAKVQSIRYVQGPISRLLRVATVRVDAAGREAVVSFRQWDEGEAIELVDRLVVACASARAG